MEVWKLLQPSTKQKLTYLFIAGLLFWISITLLLPALPTYIQDLGGTTQQVGIVMSCFAIGLIASRSYLGKVADRRSRKLVILVGTFVAALAPILYLVVQSVLGLGFIRAFHGISIAAFTIGYSALVVDLAPVAYRGTLIGYMNLAVPMGMSMGPALSGYLQARGAEYFPEGTGYEVLFVVSAVSGMLAVVLSSRITEPGLPDASTSNKPLIQRDFGQLLHDPALLIPTIILLLIGLVFGTRVAFLPLYFRELQLGFNIGLYYTVTAIASFAVRLFVGKASDRHGRGLFIGGALVCYVTSMLLLTSAQNSLMLILSAISEGAGAGMLIPLILALISDRSHSNERGQVFALCMGGFDVGIALGGLILGSLSFILGGYRGMFASATVLAVLALLVFLTQIDKNWRRSLGFALGKAKDSYTLTEL
ncbi:MAG: MFS transporter [Cyanobacteria bacterium J06621_8]